MGGGPVRHHEHNEHNEHDERDERDEGEASERAELEERQARLRTDAFGRALGESWITAGDGIYRYMPETSSLKAPTPPAEDRVSSDVDVAETLEDALTPGRRTGRGEADEPQAAERADAETDAPRQRKRSLWRRR